jgi:hypothetical protein
VSSVTVYRWLPLAAFVSFVVGFWAGRTHILGLAAADSFDQAEVEYSLWAALMGALVGFAAAAFAYTMIWLLGIVRLFRPWKLREMLSWIASVVVLGFVVFASLFRAARGAKDSLDKTLSGQTHLIIVIAAVLMIPGLVAFLALRALAAGETLARVGICGCGSCFAYSRAPTTTDDVRFVSDAVGHRYGLSSSCFARDEL